MAAPTIPNGEEHFFPVIYSGNGQGQRAGKFVPFTDDGTIVNSCMFNKADSPRLARTPGSAGNRKTWTFSAWIKRTILGSPRHQILTQTPSNGASGDVLNFNTDNTIKFTDATSSYYNLITNGTFEDTSKWYHVLLAVDTTQATASNRVKLYVDGNQITSFSTETYPSQDFQYTINNSGTPMNVYSDYGSSGAEYSDGYIAEVNMVDGQALTPSTFGVTDTSTGRWIPKTVVPSPSSTYTYTVTVVSGNPSDHPYYNFGSTNKYAIDGSTATGNVALQLVEGATYKFDQSDSSNSGHPLRFSTTPNGSWGGGSEYTTGVTTSGTPGNSGAYTQITVASGAPTLYYYCTNHSGMGWSAETPTSGITYGTNGFRLKFQNSSALGDDTSGKTNDFSVTNLTASDQRTNTPTNNLPIMRPYNPSYSQTLAEGNLKTTTGGTNVGYPMVPTLRPKSGKYYAECRVSGDGGGNTVDLGVYLQEDMHNYSSGNWYPGNNNGSGWNSITGGYAGRGFYQQLGGSSTYVQFISETIGAGDVIGMALDIDNGLLSYYNNSGSLVGSVPFDNNKTPMFAAMSNTNITFDWNFGDNGTFNGNETAGGNSDSDGNGNFYHSVPSGFKMLTQDNMPTTDRGIPGLSWVKNRDQSSNSHGLIDSSRGQSKNIFSNSDSPEQDYDKRGLVKFLKGGYSCGEYQYINGSGDRLVSWNWAGNGGTTSTNTDGSITTTTQVNSTAGFSIIQYTGTEANATIGHGLSQTPDWFMIKSLETHSPNGYWCVWQKNFAANQLIYLNLNIAIDTSTTMFNNTLPTSSVINLGSNFNTNMSGKMICYAWHEVDGYSKFGSYIANNNTDGPFVYTGFKPAFVMVKNINSAYSWFMFDNARDPSNPVSNFLAADQSTVYSSQAVLDFVSNGFKIRIGNASGANHLTNTHIYMAFAEHPFVGDGTNPVTAR